MMKTNPLLEHFPPPTDITELLKLTALYLEHQWNRKNQVIYLAIRVRSETNKRTLREIQYTKEQWELPNHSLVKIPYKDIVISRDKWEGVLWLGTRYPAAPAEHNLKGINIHIGDNRIQDSLPYALLKDVNDNYSNHVLFYKPRKIRNTLFNRAWKLTLWKDEWKEILLNNVIDPQPWFDSYGYSYFWYRNFRKIEEEE